MRCPNCGSQRISVNYVQVKGKSKHKGNGLGGHLNNAARGLTAMCTLGMSNLVWKKSKGTDNMQFQNLKVAVCQECGNSWDLADD